MYNTGDIFEGTNECLLGTLRFNCGKRCVHSVQVSNYGSLGIVGCHA